MKRKLTYIPLLLGCIATMLLSACFLDDHPTDEHAQLYIYVYSPNNPVLTRADIGQVDPSEDERRVNKLQIWVFAHEAYTYNGVTHPAGELIGYLAVFLRMTGKQFTVVKNSFYMISMTRLPTGTPLPVKVDSLLCSLIAISIVTPLPSAIIWPNDMLGSYGVSSE